MTLPATLSGFNDPVC